MADLVQEALEFATLVHGLINQKRKGSGEDYINHPIRVMETVKSRPHTPEMLAAALLHDTVEDTTTTIDEIRERFGPTVAALVADLTDVSTHEDGNRAQRKALDRQHTARSSDQAKTIKCADLIDNMDNVMHHLKSFAPTYVREKRMLLPCLKGADPVLLARCEQLVADYYAQTEGEKANGTVQT